MPKTKESPYKHTSGNDAVMVGILCKLATEVVKKSATPWPSFNNTDHNYRLHLSSIYVFKIKKIKTYFSNQNQKIKTSSPTYDSEICIEYILSI